MENDLKVNNLIDKPSYQIDQVFRFPYINMVLANSNKRNDPLDWLVEDVKNYFQNSYFWELPKFRCWRTKDKPIPLKPNLTVFYVF